MARKKAKESKKKAAEKAPASASGSEDAAAAAAVTDDENDGTSDTGNGADELIAELRSEIAAAEESLAAKDEELQQVREALARARADFANFRRRTQQEQEEQGKFATALLVAEFLPILDNFERALDTIPRELRFFSWLQGVDLVHQMARNVLEKRGLEPIDTQDKPFDPNYHEVVLREGEDGGSDVVVLEELQKGYVMYDRVLRPSLVKVGPPQSEDDAAEQETDEAGARDPGSESESLPQSDTEQA